jgi:hypothetical protein
MERGSHDVDNGYQDANHPGVIIHDSEGFQQGGKQEVKALTKFLEKRTGSVSNREKLQAIWSEPYKLMSNGPVQLTVS